MKFTTALLLIASVSALRIVTVDQSSEFLYNGTTEATTDATVKVKATEANTTTETKKEVTATDATAADAAPKKKADANATTETKKKEPAANATATDAAADATPVPKKKVAVDATATDATTTATDATTTATK